LNIQPILWIAVRAALGVLLVAAASLARFHPRQPQAATLHGAAALAQLKRDGGYASLLAALTGARQQSEAAPLANGAFLAQQQKLRAAAAPPGIGLEAFTAQFGTALALDGDTAVIGAPFDDLTRSNQGAVYLFTRDGTRWMFQQRLRANDSAADDLFGFSVDYTLTVNRVCQTITINPSTLPNATLGAVYSEQLTASGGPEPFSFVRTAGALPSGLRLAANGVLSGIATAAGTFNFTVTAADANGCTATRSYTLASNPAAVISVSAASFLPGVAPDSIVAVFGTQLSSHTQAAASLPLPVELGGVRVRIRDSQGVERLASLFFVSPGQINLLIPADTTSGPATLSISNSNLSNAATGELTITRTAPGLFAANANGQGVPAAVALRVRADGTSLFEPVAQLEGDRFVPAPIDLGPVGEQVSLVLFGTGIRFQQTVTASVGGANVNVLFAGAAAGFAGLDQVNLLLPPLIAGAALLLCGRLPAAAQGIVRAQVPFDFQVNGQQLKAGEYIIIRDSQEPRRLLIHSSEWKLMVIINTIPHRLSKAPTQTSLLFQSYGGQYFLAEVRVEGNEDSYALVKSKAERKLARLAEAKPQPLP
jgi:uncharacterized protein (TIGR03437 family)